MRKFFLFAVLLTACTSNPPVAKSCDGRELLVYETHGRSADRTVQYMLQSPTLIDGRPADPELWPASVYAHIGNSACSATLIGERVLLVASHCVNNGAGLSFSAHANNYTARCSHHPEYDKGNLSADWSLCLVERPVTGVLFESIGVNEKLKIGEVVTLSGYGCTNMQGNDGNDGIFRVGDAKIEGLPYKNDYDVVTHGGAALCFGDSGGSAYVEKGDKRFIFGVNSRGDIHTTSFLPSVGTKAFTAWAKTWALNFNNVKICGLHDDALYCRNTIGTMSNAPPKESFEVNSKAACVKGTLNPDYSVRKNEIITSVQQALDKF